MSTLLLTRPNHDPFTNYLHYWSKPLIELANAKNINVVDLPIDKATRKHVESRVKKLKPEFLLFNGHGKKGIVGGHEDEHILDLSNAYILISSIVYTVSCRSIDELGQKAVDGGAKAFIGYMKDFWLCTDLTKSTTPTKDSIAAYFLEPANAVTVSLLKGHTVNESYTKSQNAHKKIIKSLLSSAADPEMAQYVKFLITNMKGQTFKGDGKATL